MNLFNYSIKSKSLKKTNETLNKSSNQKLFETLLSTLLLVLAYDALLFGSDYLLQYYQNSETTSTLLTNKTLFNITIPVIIGTLNTSIRFKKNRIKLFNARMNLAVIEHQIKHNTDIYYLDAQAISEAKAIKLKVINEEKEENISVYAADPASTYYVDDREVKSPSIKKLASTEESKRFVYFQEKEEKDDSGNIYYKIESLDPNIKYSLLEQTDNISLAPLFSKKIKRRIKVKVPNKKI